MDNEIFHIVSRGVDKRKIFLDDQDYLRFIHNLKELNDQKRTSNNNYVFSRHPIDIVSRYDEKPLVENLAFCLMPNHYHLLLNPIIEKGITKFMQKINIGYAKYFNQKYKRKGTLFEGRFKSVIVKNEAHFIHLPYYIHLNPLDLVTPEWRTGEIKNYQYAIDFLEKYRWSSHLDYLGRNNFPSVTNRKFLTEFFGDERKYAKDIKEWIKERTADRIKNLTLE